MRRMVVASCVLVGFVGSALAADEIAAPAPRETVAGAVENFRLIDHQDRSWELNHQLDAPAVVLVSYSNACPAVKESIPTLNQLQKDFAAKGVVFLMVDADDPRDAIRAAAKENQLAIPVLTDPTQRIAFSLGMKLTAEALVIAPKDKLRIAYRGAIAGVRDAVSALVEKRPVTTAAGEVRGTPIAYRQSDAISYAKDIAPILKDRCAHCHRPGGMAPFALSNRKKVQSWAPMIREVMRSKRMPPWHADPHYGAFRDTYALSTGEERTLLTWLDAGAPDDGQGEDALAGVPAAPADDWALGPPDLVLTMPQPAHLPAEGKIDYHYVPVASKLHEDKWVRAAQVLPSSRASVHHALIFIIYPAQYGHLQQSFQSGLRGYFEAFLPGAPIRPYPEGTGQFVPAGSIFIFQMHYTATGKPETDQTRMGLYFYDSPPPNALITGAAATTRFDIQPYVADTPVAVKYKFPRDATIYGLSPHMHFRGSRARFDMTTPDGKSNTLLNVPFYEFDWQPMYELQKPLEVKKGTLVDVAGGWDNSRFNPKNPDPSVRTGFGEQSWREMFIGYIKYAVPRDPNTYSPKVASAK